MLNCTYNNIALLVASAATYSTAIHILRNALVHCTLTYAERRLLYLQLVRLQAAQAS